MKKASGSSPEAFFVSPERKSSGTRTLLLERVNGFAPLFPLSLILLLKLDTVLAVLLIPGRAFSAFLSEVSPLLLSLRLAVSGVRRALIVGRDIFGFLRSLRGVRGAALSDALHCLIVLLNTLRGSRGVFNRLGLALHNVRLAPGIGFFVLKFLCLLLERVTLSLRDPFLSRIRASIRDSAPIMRFVGALSSRTAPISPALASFPSSIFAWS